MATTEKLQQVIEGAKSGNPGDINDLAMLYMKGIGVEQNVDIAIKLFEKAAEGKNLTAMKNLAVIYRDGERSCKPDAEKYLYYLDLAIQNGYEEGTGEFVRGAIGKAGNTKQPFVWLDKAEDYAYPYAEKGEGSFLLAFCTLREMTLCAYLGLDEKGIFLDNPDELARLCQEYFRNAEKLLSFSDDIASSTKKGINKIAQGVYQAGCRYLHQDQYDKAQRCFEIVEDYVLEAKMRRTWHLITKTVNNHIPYNNPIYCKHLQTLLNIVARENEVQDTLVYARRVCSTLACFYLDGVGTSVDIDRAYEFTAKAAAYGDPQAQQRLKHFKRNLRGNYTYKD